jgi:hypothetical protein
MTHFVLSFYGRMCYIFIFRRETAVDIFTLTRGEGVEVLLFREQLTFYLSDRGRRVLIFRREEAVDFLFFGLFSDRRSRRLSIFPTQVTVDFYSSTISQFRMVKCNFDVLLPVFLPASGGL